MLYPEPSEDLLQRAGEVVHSSDLCGMLVIVGHNTKLTPDGGLPFDRIAQKLSLFTTVDRCISIGLLNNFFELQTEKTLILYEVPRHRGSFLDTIFIPLRILEASPDLTGWVNISVELTYDRTPFIESALEGQNTYQP